MSEEDCLFQHIFSKGEDVIFCINCGIVINTEKLMKMNG